MRRITFEAFLAYFVGLCVLVFPIPTFASSTNGTIDSSYKYAWGDKLGWVNFGATNGGVSVTDSVVTGYAWSDVLGWINLAPSNSGVINDAEGDLSGYAWNESAGWINFANVAISNTGIFSGTAATDAAGTLTFDCGNCDVRTDWRPASTRSSGGGSGSSYTDIRQISTITPSTTNPGSYTLTGTGVGQGVSQIQLISNTPPTTTFTVPVYSILSDGSINFTPANDVPPGNYLVRIVYSNGYVVTSSTTIAVNMLPNPVVMPAPVTPPPIIQPPAKLEFFRRPFEYEWVSQNGIVKNKAHTIYVKAGQAVDLNLAIRNRSKDTKALVIYGKKDLVQEAPPYRGAHELRVGTARPRDRKYSWLDSASYISNPDGGTNRFAVYDGDPVQPGGIIQYNWQIKLRSDVAPGEYNFYVSIVREFDSWAVQVNKQGKRLRQEDMFWRIVVEP